MTTKKSNSSSMNLIRIVNRTNPSHNFQWMHHHISNLSWPRIKGLWKSSEVQKQDGKSIKLTIGQNWQSKWLGLMLNCGMRDFCRQIFKIYASWFTRLTCSIIGCLSAQRAKIWPKSVPCRKFVTSNLKCHFWLNVMLISMDWAWTESTLMAP